MGYTHYWQPDPVHSIIAWTAFAVCAAKVLRVSAVPLAGPDGTGNPLVMIPHLGLPADARALEQDPNSEAQWQVVSDRRLAGGNRQGEWIAFDLLIAASMPGDELAVACGRARPTKRTKRLVKDAFARRAEFSTSSEDEYVSFNGAAPDDFDEFTIERLGKDDVWDLCKTGGPRGTRPYDVAVVAVLCLFHHFTGNDVWSDGDENDWAEGLALASSVVPTCSMPDLAEAEARYQRRALV